MKILDHNEAINPRQDKRLIIVETAIHRVSCLNLTHTILYFRLTPASNPLALRILDLLKND